MPGDEELVVAAGKGNLQAFETIVVRHQASAWRIACRLLGDPDEARDVVQNAFLKLLDAAPRYHPTAPFTTYFSRIVVNLCLDHRRRKRHVCADGLSEIEDSTPSSLEILLEQERRRAVHEALATLPPNQRAAIVLRYYEEMGYTEIAEVLDTSAKAVERLLARGRAALETSLAEWLDM